jgi:hypothetical protein
LNTRWLAVVLVSAAACSRGAERRLPPSIETPSAPAAPVVSSSPTPRGTLALGEPITASLVPLAEIAKSPARYADQLVGTTGKVTAVCQEMGCWMEIQDDSGEAHVRMHGHAFFVPKTAAGHVARVQAKVLRRNDEACTDSPPPHHAVATVELDATGVELD